MLQYRVYRLNAGSRIMSGEWFVAESDDQMIEQAQQMCDGDTPSLEIWQGRRKVAVVSCDGVEAASSADALPR